MNWIRRRVLAGETLIGAWISTGSDVVTEILGQAPFDWLLLDREHGPGDYDDLRHQLQALARSKAAPIVRIVGNWPPHFKQSLDLGAAGIMVPWVNSAADARAAVAAMRYPPQGTRGLSGSVRAGAYGRDFADYFARANRELLTVVQIETAEAVACADEIAAVDGVDVLFIGPADLTLGLDIPQQLDHPRFQAACQKVVQACANHGKQAGILLKERRRVEKAIADGFRLVAVGLDTGFLATGIQEALNGLRGCLESPPLPPGEGRGEGK
jgi:2-keto-3-deoxy-L-rhamnonate aldolase RhmA